MSNLTSSPQLPALVGSAISDFLAALGVSPAGTIGSIGGAIIDACSSRARENARRILLEEIKVGDRFITDSADLDEFVAICLRYDRAAIEGTAHWKLRLMARVLNGQIESDALVADQFVSLAEVIAALRDEEIKFAATVHQLAPSFDNAKELCDRLEQELIPRVFQSADQMHAIGVAVQRTGLIIRDTGTWDGIPAYVPTPLMDEFVALARLESI